MKYLMLLIALSLIGCADIPIPQFSLGDKVRVELNPFYKKCLNQGTIIEYRTQHYIFSHGIRYSIDLSKNQLPNCPVQVFRLEEDLI